MKLKVAACLLWIGLSSLLMADTLDQGFANPPAGARPHTWWHWMNCNVTREGITADLEAMARVASAARRFSTSARTSPSDQSCI